MEAVKMGKTKLDEFIDAVVNSRKSADELLQEGSLNCPGFSGDSFV